jgi:hypothetical protein
MLKPHPQSDPLRGDPRFEAIVVSLAPKDGLWPGAVHVSRRGDFCFADNLFFSKALSRWESAADQNPRSAEASLHFDRHFAGAEPLDSNRFSSGAPHFFAIPRAFSFWKVVKTKFAQPNEESNGNNSTSDECRG